jgi:predicted metal-dependent phosphoesterase TrpH
VNTLKIDFHIHTGEDPKDRYIPYSAKELIEEAAACQFDVIAITNHKTVTYTDELRGYAEEQGLLLIPGVEMSVEGKHVLIVNYRQACPDDLTLRELRAYVGEDALIIAPHPFYPRYHCLQEALEEHIAFFDAIEYSHFYFWFLNPNTKAVALAQKYGLPLVGTSDAHSRRQLNQTYTLVEAHKTIPSIIEAVRARRTRVVSKPLNSWKFFSYGSWFLLSFFRRRIRKLVFRASSRSSSLRD